MNMSNTNYTKKTPYKHLTAIQRGKLEVLRKEGKSVKDIADELGGHRSTIYREIKRGSVTQAQNKNSRIVYQEVYFADAAQRLSEQRRAKSYFIKLQKISQNFLTAFHEAMIAKPRVHSVDTFINIYTQKHPEEVIPSTKTMYNYIHQNLLDVKLIDLPRAVRMRSKSKKRPSTKKHIGTSIDERPESINDRSEFGHWEIDSVLGKVRADEPSILTLVERQTRYALTVYLDGKKAEYVNQAVLQLRNHYPIRSITADNGTEFSKLSEIEGIDVYFAHAYSSHERGTNENFNGLLREFIPKGQSLKQITADYLEEATTAINERPRRILGMKTAKNLFELAQIG